MMHCTPPPPPPPLQSSPVGDRGHRVGDGDGDDVLFGPEEEEMIGLQVREVDSTNQGL